MARLAPASFNGRHSASDRLCLTGDNDLPRRVEVDPADKSVGSRYVITHLRNHSIFKTENDGHTSLTHRNGLLHCSAPLADKLCTVG
jgi:hypothetical protein